MRNVASFHLLDLFFLQNNFLPFLLSFDLLALNLCNELLNLGSLYIRLPRLKLKFLGCNTLLVHLALVIVEVQHYVRPLHKAVVRAKEGRANVRSENPAHFDS
jgi:hypothetical protein